MIKGEFLVGQSSQRRRRQKNIQKKHTKSKLVFGGLSFLFYRAICSLRRQKFHFHSDKIDECNLPTGSSAAGNRDGWGGRGEGRGFDLWNLLNVTSTDLNGKSRSKEAQPICRNCSAQGCSERCSALFSCAAIFLRRRLSVGSSSPGGLLLWFSKQWNSRVDLQPSLATNQLINCEMCAPLLMLWDDQRVFPV